jgi:hypothetical protein
MPKSNAKLARVQAARDELEGAIVSFQAAIDKFRKVHDCETVGLDYWSAGLDDTLSEIDEDIAEAFGLE